MPEMILLAPDLAILYLRVISGADPTMSYELIARSLAAFLGIPLACCHHKTIRTP
jgi:ACR3 family arsenite transporter